MRADAAEPAERKGCIRSNGTSNSRPAATAHKPLKTLIFPGDAHAHFAKGDARSLDGEKREPKSARVRASKARTSAVVSNPTVTMRGSP